MEILIFGDSITQGFDDKECVGWVNRLFIDVSARTDPNNNDYIGVHNLGIDGDTTKNLLNRIESEIKARKEEENIIIFDIGSNDAMRNLVSNEMGFLLSSFQRIIRS